MNNLFSKTIAILLISGIFSSFAQQPVGVINSSVQSFNICQGGSVTFGAAYGGGNGGPYTFDWDNNGPSISSTYSPPSTSVVGSYVVTLTIYDNIGVASNLITAPYNIVVPNGPLPSVSLSSTSVCPYDTLRLNPALGTLIAGSSYCNGLAPPGQCDIVPLPGTFPASYTVNLSNTPYTCNTEYGFTINSSGAQSCFQAPAISTGPLVLTNQSQVPASGNNFSINYDVTIPTGTTINFSNHQVYIAPGVKIIVRPGATLNISGSWLHACNCMWYGIEVQGNGTVNISKASIIEDAIYAISTDQGLNSTPTIKVNRALFNKNNVSIYVRQKSTNLSSSIYVNDNIFTCRDFTQPNANYLSTLQNSSTTFNTLLNFFYNQWSNLGQSGFPVFPQALTAYNHRSNAGILLLSCTGPQINVGQNPSVIAGPYPISNIFDYLNYGILARHSNLYVHKNQFQNHSGNAVYNPLNPGKTGPLNNLKAMGVGVYADNEALMGIINVGKNASGSVIAANLFYNNLRGVDIYNYLRVDVGFNQFNNTSTSPLNSFPTPGTWNAQYGIQMSNLNGPASALPDQVIHDNFIDRDAYGIHVMRSFYNAAKILILCNELGKVNNVNVPSVIYMYQGIVLEDVAGNTNANIPINGYAVSSNTVRHARQNAIFASGIKKGLFIVFNGTKTLHWPGSCNGDVSVDPGTPIRESACIQTSFCDNGSIFCNEFINSRHPSGPLKNRVNYAHGILVDNSTRMTVTGNEVAGAHARLL